MYSDASQEVPTYPQPTVHNIPSHPNAQVASGINQAVPGQIASESSIEEMIQNEQSDSPDSIQEVIEASKEKN